MKVIFLDIDGVLNSKNYDRGRDWNKMTFIDESRLPLLKELVDKTGAKIVLSTTWRVHWDKIPQFCDSSGRYIQKTFEKYGLTIYDKTPHENIMAERCEEIKQWLKECEENIESFVIIDDYMYGWGNLKDNFVKTKAYKDGLEQEDIQKAIEILKG